MFKNILVPTDGEPLSFKAVEIAMSMASVHQAKLSVVTVSPIYPRAIDPIKR
jgi:nucleotide-binding universal stress UspA family protein